jgi:hypothetical protein
MNAPARRLVWTGMFALFVTGACDPDRNIDSNNLREDVLYCEDALAHLGTCCPDFHADEVRCHHYAERYDHVGCSSSIHSYEYEDPALSLDESRCIISTGCDALRANGVCARAQAAIPYLASGFERDFYSVRPESSSMQTHAPVCP